MRKTARARRSITTARSRTNGTVDAAQCLGSIVERYRVAEAEETVEEDPARL